MARYYRTASRFVCIPTGTRKGAPSKRLAPAEFSALPMSLREAVAIYTAMGGHGALHRLHELGVNDPLALRAVEVIQTATY